MTVKNNTYKDIILNQAQSEGRSNGEIQQYRDIENRSITTIENQPTEFHQNQQEKFTQIRRPHIPPNSNKNLQKWVRNAIVSDSMLPDIDERRIS